MRKGAPSDEVVVDGLGAESGHFLRWFNRTLCELRGMGNRYNPLPELLRNQAFHPWFVFWGLYRSCDPVRERSLSAARARLRTVRNDLRTCVSLLKRLDAALSKVEVLHISSRLHSELPQISVSDSYQPRDVRQLSADLRGWQKRFGAREYQFSRVTDERKSFARNNDDRVGLMCYMRDIVGSSAPGVVAKLLQASFSGHGRDGNDVTTQALINLEKRFRKKHAHTYASLKERAARMTEEAAKITGEQRESFRRRLFGSASASERQEIDQPFLQYIRKSLASNPRFTKHS